MDEECTIGMRMRESGNDDRERRGTEEPMYPARSVLRLSRGEWTFFQYFFYLFDVANIDETYFIFISKI